MLTSVTPPSVEFLRKMNSTGSSSFISTAFRRSQIKDDDDSDDLITTLINPETSSITQDEEPTSTATATGAAGPSHISDNLRFSSCDLPPPQEQSSLAQSIINGEMIIIIFIINVHYYL